MPDEREDPADDPVDDNNFDLVDEDDLENDVYDEDSALINLNDPR